MHRHCSLVLKTGGFSLLRLVRVATLLTWAGVEDVALVPALVDVRAPRVGLPLAHALMVRARRRARAPSQQTRPRRRRRRRVTAKPESHHSFVG